MKLGRRHITRRSSSQHDQQLRVALSSLSSLLAKDPSASCAPSSCPKQAVTLGTVGAASGCTDSLADSVVGVKIGFLLSLTVSSALGYNKTIRISQHRVIVASEPVGLKCSRQLCLVAPSYLWCHLPQ